MMFSRFASKKRPAWTAQMPVLDWLFEEWSQGDSNSCPPACHAVHPKMRLVAAQSISTMIFALYTAVYTGISR